MTLRCLDPTSNSSIHAFDLSPEAWLELGRKNKAALHLRMPCCTARVTLKRSTLGTQFFAHKAIGSCVTAPETETHLRLKRMVVEVARANGWHAETEVTEGAWRADVLACKGAAKVAVEIQWSPQTNEETLRRQARYAEAGVRCLWLLRQSNFPIIQSLPAACIGGTIKDGFVAIVPTGSSQQTLPMRDFLEAAFTKRLCFGVPFGRQARVSAYTGSIFCWNCGAETNIITRIEVSFGPHNYRFSVPDLTGYPGLFEIVRQRLQKNLNLGAVKHRFSKTQERAYLSNGCAHCDALIGEFHEHDAWDDQQQVCSFAIRIDEHWRQALKANSGYEDGWGVYPPG